MNFNRMGYLSLSDMQLRPMASPDNSFLPFEIVDPNVLCKAHFLDVIKSATIYFFHTYKIVVKCKMKSGYKVEMEGICTQEEFNIIKGRAGQAGQLLL